MSAQTRSLALSIQRENDLKEHARKSHLRLMVAMDALKLIRDAAHKSGRAKRIAASAIEFIENALM